jgi:hypothetical protein
MHAPSIRHKGTKQDPTHKNQNTGNKHNNKESDVEKEHMKNQENPMSP